MNGKIKHEKYKAELEEAILKEFIKKSGITCDYERREPPEPDFFCNGINIYIEVTTCAYDKNIGQDTHMLQRGVMDLSSFNSRRTVISDIDQKLADAISSSVEDKMKKDYETNGYPVWLIVYADCPLQNQSEIEDLNVLIEQDKFQKIFVLYKQARDFEIHKLIDIE